ncbi:MAG: hypothetical protein ACREVZ_11490, partial [Burkholderiales bacterium]
MNMVRAGVVKHPAEWMHGGYREIQDPPERYSVIEVAHLSALCGFANVADFQRAHREWVAQALTREAHRRDKRWSEAIAVGSRAFVETVQRELGISASYREVDGADGT